MAGEAMVYEFRIRRPDGETRRIRARVAPIRTADGRVHRLTGTALDVTEADQLEQQLRQAQKMEAVGTLAGGVAHDFNNLLTIIGGFADLLAVRLQADPRSKEMVAEIRRSVDRAASLTRQLLAFSRKQVLAPVVLDLNRIVAETSRMVQRLIGEDIEFNAVPDPGLGPIRADPGQVEQVLMNLVINARDAMPTGGRLTVETRRVVLDDGETCIRTELRPGEYSVVSVSDTGTGMAPEVQQHIFEPFFTTKAAGRGTGLGLATVYGIVKQSGGGVQVYSEVGIGTTFKVYFPVTTGSVARATTSPVAAPGGKETILLVEDDNTVRALVRTMLEQVGYNVLEAADGFMALDRAKSHGPGIDLLITDVVMPRAGGRHVVDALKSERPDIKVLYLSGYTDDAIVRHGILQGGANFLQKPFTATVLTTRVREILDG
jgi:two-component system cell cycle sensor histidine kinase/response regulator CckA